MCFCVKKRGSDTQREKAINGTLATLATLCTDIVDRMFTIKQCRYNLICCNSMVLLELAFYLSFNWFFPLSKRKSHLHNFSSLSLSVVYYLLFFIQEEWYTNIIIAERDMSHFYCSKPCYGMLSVL